MGFSDIKIPQLVSYIASSAFWGCQNLDKIICKGNTPPIIGNNNSDDHSNTELYVPMTSLDNYKSSDGWKDFNIKGYTVSETGIAIIKDNVVLRPGLKERLIALDCRETVISEDFLWTSSDDNVATIDQEGKVTALSNGCAIITATAKDDANAKASCNVIVVENGSNSIYAIDETLHCNTSVELPVFMDNANEIGNVQFDLQIPNGVYIDTPNRGEERFDDDLDHNITYSCIQNAVSSKSAENTIYRITIISNSNSLIYDTDANGNDCRNTSPLITIPLNFMPWAPEGIHEVFIKNAIMSNNINGITNRYTCDTRSSYITIPLTHYFYAKSANYGIGYINIKGDYYNENLHFADENSQVTITATPYTGYSFKRWLKGEEEFSTDNPLTLTVTEDIDLTAEFKINQHTVKFIADDKVISEQVLDYGTTITVPDAPEKAGYVFYSWGDVPATVPDYDLEFVASYVKYGDVYEDGTIDVADVTKLAGIVINNTPLSDREKKQADVYADNSIDVADVSTIVSMALSYEPESNNSKAMAKAGSSSDELNTEVTISPEGYYNIGIGLGNILEGVKGLQFDMQLPEGIKLVSASLNKTACASHTLQMRTLADGTVRMIVYGLSDKNLNSENGDILNVCIGTNDAGSDVTLFNAVYVDGNCEKHSLASSIVSMSEGATNISGLTNGGLHIITGKDYMTVNCEKDSYVTVSNMAGTVIYSGMVTATRPAQIPVSSGVYLVNNSKVVVK